MANDCKCRICGNWFTPPPARWNRKAALETCLPCWAEKWDLPR